MLKNSKWSSLTVCAVTFASFSLVDLKRAEGACVPPAWADSKDIPACPSGGSSLIPETNPPLAVVISKLQGWSVDPNTAKPRVDNAPMRKFVVEALKAAGDQLPKIILVGVDPTEVETLKADIKVYCNIPSNGCKNKIQTWNNALQPTDGEEFQWQQDYYQPSFDPLTGRPVIRPISGYDNGIDGKAEAGKIAKATSPLCVKLGSSIPPATEKTVLSKNAAMGGNIEALPGGLCLHGSNQPWASFGKYYCGDEKNSVAIDANWLSVGHADEIIGLVPDKGNPPPCNFAITWASPQKALDLMKTDENRKASFFDFYKDPTYREQLDFEAVKDVCTDVIAFRKSKNKSSPDRKDKSPSDGLKSVPAAWLRFIIEEAMAGDDSTIGGCKGVSPPTNEEVASVLEKAGYNLLIEERMKQNQKVVQKKIEERTGCKNVRYIPVPNLFFGGQALDPRPDTLIKVNGRSRKFSELSEDEKASLPIKQRYKAVPEKRALGLLPNPTNAVLIGNTLLAPKPWNASFANYLNKTYDSLGVSFKEIDTFDANANQGNLHCSTNTLRICNPSTAGATP